MFLGGRLGDVSAHRVGVSLVHVIGPLSSCQSMHTVGAANDVRYGVVDGIPTAGAICTSACTISAVAAAAVGTCIYCSHCCLFFSCASIQSTFFLRRA